MTKVLLVGTEVFPNDLVRGHLSGLLQIELETVSSLNGGIDRIKSLSPDLILLKNPEGDLHSLSELAESLQKLRNAGNSIPVILYSVHQEKLLFIDISLGINSINLSQTESTHHILTAVRHTTGRSRVERSLREDYDQNHRIINGMPFSCLIVKDGEIKYSNQRFFSLTGYSDESIVGKRPFSLLDHEKYAAEQEITAALFENKPLDTSLIDKSNNRIPCRITLLDKQGDNPGDGIWYIEDRREYESLLAVLKETEFECKEQLYLSETIVIRLRPDGIITFANQAAIRCFGYESDILTGTDINLLFPHGMITDSEPPSDLFLDISDESSSSALHIFEHLKRDGSRLWIAWTSRGLYSNDNLLTGIICVGTDMTDQTSNGLERISTRVWRDRILESSDVLAEVFDVLLQACIEIGREGREGKAIGTSFLVGDDDEVLRNSRQLILNPFHGHPTETRNVINVEVREMLKEYALLDGAFVVTGDGMLQAAGRYITLDTSRVSLPKGMGTRHSSVAALTSVTNAIGFVVSESGGKVSIIRNGKIVKVIA